MSVVENSNSIVRIGVSHGLRDLSARGDVTPRQVVVWALLSTLCANCIFFMLYAALAWGTSVTSTFIASSISGAVATVVATLWLRLLSGGKAVQTAIVLAYVARLAVGVALDGPTNYYGDGGYAAENPEYTWTYEMAIKFADCISHYGVFSPYGLSYWQEDKNAGIHAWMGCFFAVGRSRNALDLACFNAFHHALAGSLMAAVALGLAYSKRASFLSGAVTAWIPWAFPATIMWRDSVGFCWLVLAVLLLVYGRHVGVLARLALMFPAALLAYCDRDPYVIVMAAAAIVPVKLWDYENERSLQKVGSYLMYACGTAVLVSFAVLYPSAYQLVFERHPLYIQEPGMQRALVLPLLVLRGVAGPFPWIQMDGTYDFDHLFDHAYHVFQLALFFTVVRHIREILRNLNVLLLVASSLWLIAIMASGVHTAYIAIAVPFAFPAIFEAERRFGWQIVISVGIFIIANLLYVAIGLHGAGAVLNRTGY
jgi:hypothetical protein